MKDQNWNELFKELASFGLGTLSLTEEAIKNYIKDKKMPKELASTFLEILLKKKDEFHELLIKELALAFSKIDFSKVVKEFIENNKPEINVFFGDKKMRKMRIIDSPNAPKAIGPYSQAVIFEPFIFLSGQIAIDPKTNNLVGSNVKEQAEQIFKNIEAILKEEGLLFEHILKTTVYLKSMSDFSQMNEIYQSKFTPPYPARSTVEVSSLPKNALIEIEVLAYRNVRESEKFF